MKPSLLRPGIPERQTYDYVRHGATALSPALEVATGKVIDTCRTRYRHQEFLRFIKRVAKAYTRVPLHPVYDNYATHKHPTVRAGLARNCDRTMFQQLLSPCRHCTHLPSIPLTLFSTHPAQLPDSLATVAADPLAFTELIRLLRQYGLVRVESSTLVLHRLLAAILRAQSHQQPDLATLTIGLLRAAVPDDPWNNPQAWSAWRQLLPHVLVATDPHRTLDGVEQDVAWLLDYAARYLQTRGEPTPAQPLFERARELRRSQLGDDHPHTLKSANNLAADRRELGEYEQARQLNEDTLTRMRQVLGDDHPDTLRAANSLAAILREDVFDSG